MRKSVHFLIIMVVCLMLTACAKSKSGKIEYARLPVDTTAHDDVERMNKDAWVDEPLIETGKDASVDKPDRKATKEELDEYMLGN